MVPKKIYVITGDIETLDEETPTVETWVCLNPHKGGRTEYTDLSQVWHDASEEPEKKGKLMIGVDVDGFSIYKWVDQDEDGWLSFAKSSGLIRWAYAEDLLPKSDKNKL